MMKSGLLEAVGAVFHCGAHLAHPGSWSKDRSAVGSAVGPRWAFSGIFGQKHAESSVVGTRQCATVRLLDRLLRYPASPWDGSQGSMSVLPPTLFFRYFLGQPFARTTLDRVAGVGLGVYFKCLMTMKSGLTEAVGAVFHCCARLRHPRCSQRTV